MREGDWFFCGQIEGLVKEELSRKKISDSRFNVYKTAVTTGKN